MADSFILEVVAGKKRMDVVLILIILVILKETYRLMEAVNVRMVLKK